jgi:hypothetical protein
MLRPMRVRCLLLVMTFMLAGCTHGLSPVAKQSAMADRTPSPRSKAVGVPSQLKASLVRIDVATGKLVSRQELSFQSPIYKRAASLVTLDQKTGQDVPLAVIDPSPSPNGPFHYPKDSGGHDGDGQHLVTVRGIAVLHQGDLVVGVRVRPAQLLWRSSDHGYRAASAQGDGRRAYGAGVLTTADFASRGRVYAIDPARGDIKWAQPTGMDGAMQGRQVLLRSGHVLVAETDPTVGGSGAVEAFDAGTGRRLWTVRLPEGTVTSMSTQGRLLVVTTQSTAYFSD